ncbi:MAG: hypothetical protein CL920_24935 [Deltaproteobacteria bacterium]|nr:hypothetical protein [Deltaproteobacteria bacterium]
MRTNVFLRKGSFPSRGYPLFMLSFLSFMLFTFGAEAGITKTVTVPYTTASRYQVSSTSKVLISGGHANLLSMTAGTGRDGDLAVTTGTTNLTTYTSQGRSVGDGVYYRVSAMGNNSVTINVTAAGLAVGDEVLLIHMQGAATRAGNWEVFRINAISGTQVTFDKNIAQIYGSTANSNLAGQIILLQRIPNYNNVTIAAGATLTANAWNGAGGGILAFRTRGTLTIAGTLTMSGRGYRGAPHAIRRNNAHGERGEGYCGGYRSIVKPPNNYLCNGGGGGEGYQDGAGGGGGGHAANGANGQNSHYCSGTGGCPHDGGAGGRAAGNTQLTRIFMGGGGGMGGRDEDGGYAGGGGTGGGIIFAFASHTNLTGNIQSNGGNGRNGGGGVGCGMGGGGGGAGGSIYVGTNTFIGTGTLTVNRGARGAGNGCGDNGGVGAFGRIRIDYQYANGLAQGQTAATTFINARTNPDAGYTDKTSGFYTDRPWVSTTFNFQDTDLLRWLTFAQTAAPTNQGSFVYQLHDGQGTQYYWNGSAWTPTTKADGTETNNATTINANIDKWTQARLGVRTYLVSNGNQPTALDLLTLTYRANKEPSITTTPPTTATEDQPYAYLPVVQDADDTKFTYKLTRAPAGAKIDPNTGAITWTPGNADAEKEFDFEVVITDADGGSVTQTWKVKVTNVNDPPKITSTPPTNSTEDVTYTYTPNVDDPDPNETLTFKLTKAPSGAKIDPNTGKIEWTPGDADVNAGKQDFEVEVCDKAGVCDKQAWSVNVANVNDVPSITTTPPTSATEKTAYTYAPQALDPDPGETQTWKLNKGPSGMKIDPNTGAITWTPGDQDAGQEPDVEIEVCDKSGACRKQSWKVKVSGVNDPPKITSTPPTQSKEDDVYTYSPKVEDPDVNDTHTWKLKKGPSGAKIDPNTGKIEWTPGDAEAGKDVDFEIEVCDKAGSCVTQSWKTSVENINDKPVISGTPPTEAYVQKEVTYEPKVTDVDPGDTHTWSLTKAPSGAKIDPNTGKITWTPVAADAGKDIDFEVQVCDKAGDCVKQTFKIPVKQTCVTDVDCLQQQICVQQTLARVCVDPGCATQSPKCQDASQYCNDGQCISNPCSGKLCAPGEVCRSTDGKCIKPCAGVTCVSGEKCVDGACVTDPCASLTCAQDERCDASDANNPKCVKDQCKTGSCKHGRLCIDDICVEDPCTMMTCPNPQNRCVAGQCIDRQTCTIDIDCPSQEICTNGRCYPSGCYTTSPTCPGADQQCTDGKCEDNQCKGSNPKQCAADEFCRPSDGACAKSCANIQCATGQTCVDGQCKQDPCASVTCGVGKVCVQGDCKDDKCSVKDPCKHGRTCNKQLNLCQSDPCAGVQCPNSQEVCREGQCVAPPNCTFDKDCPGTSICVSGNCKVTSCSSDSDCNGGKLCVEGECKDNPCDGVQCASGTFCKAGKCVDSCAGVFCKQDELCREGACGADPCAGKQCQAGEVCVSGTCKSTTCQQDSCKGGRTCDVDKCVSDPCQGISCPTGQTCQEGQCTGTRACKVDTDCPGQAVCVDEKCIEAGCYQEACADGKLCLKGTCVDNPCANKQCAEGETCRPVDGTCVKNCEGCATGQRCVAGECKDDPCASVQCNPGQTCKDGTCEDDLCAGNTPACRYQRDCDVKTCQDDPCKGVTCPTDFTCQEGACVGPPKSEKEPTNTEETTQDAGEPMTEITKEVNNPTEPKVETVVPLASGGCGCTVSADSSGTNTLWALFFVLVVGLTNLYRRRR